MIVAFAVPVADDDMVRAASTFAAWRALGYATAALVDGEQSPDNCNHVVRTPPYRGWASAVNRLSDHLPWADWIVTGGVDIMPVAERTADDLSNECGEHFRGTYGVMQPTGDRYGALLNEPMACVSPWLGREWRQQHPLHEGYRHFWADAELFHVAQARCRLWLRPELVQYHDHWARRGEAEPGHLAPATAANADDRALFEQRLAAGFP